MTDPIASPRFRCVVAAIDFSPESERALAWAKHLASQRDAELLLVHAVSLPAAPDAFAFGNQWLEEILTDARDRLEKLKAGLVGEVRSVSCVVAEGFAVNVILETASARGADLVVLGTRGLTGWKHVLLGSTAQRVIAKSECPVLAVHGSDPLPAKGGWRVLAATDGSTEALAAVHTGLRLVGPSAGKVVLLRAFEPPPLAYPATAEIFVNRWLPESRRIAEDNLEGAARTLNSGQAPVATLLRDGFAAQVIVGEATQNDLVVMGTRGGGLGHLFLGSTAERVTQHATVPVLVVPHTCTAMADAQPIVGAVLARSAERGG